MAKKSAKSTYDLVIVESPAKAKTIEKFLGKGYRVTASNGHIRDLPKSKIGVDIENNFNPSYIVIRGRSSILKSLKDEAAKADKVYLATDPDREGEAISWHIAELLNLDVKDTCRIEFNEITKSAVDRAIQHPRAIDIDRVNAQQARRILDRLVGYKLSPLLWQKVKKGLSAGRVQSVAVKLIVDRENEIRSFVPEEFWTITALLSDQQEKNTFECKYYGKAGKKIELKNEEQTNSVLEAIKGKPFTIENVKKGTKQKRPFAPFTTSSLQQDASRKLGFTTKKTMMIAQTLYEGVSISSTETVGLITYTRTDSTRISKEAQDASHDYILQKYGKEYLPEKPNIYTGRKNAQDAHEAIRPTYMDKTPEMLKSSLTNDQYKLYRLIYTRFMASQMTPARYDTLSYDIDSVGYTFKAAGSRMTFKGYTIIYKENLPEEEEKNEQLPLFEIGTVLKLSEITPKQNFTQPPQRYTEATLVKVLEEKGIGRPSTYSPIISTIQDRGYVAKESKALVPTELGEIVTDIMNDNFPNIVNVQFTADMEDNLDDIENEGEDWHKLIENFYTPFSKDLSTAEQKIEKVKIPDRPAGIKCEKCGAEMVYKQGRFGEFIACPNYPACKNTKAIKTTIKTPCPLCGGAIVVKKTSKGKNFYGCENYPECKFVSWDMPIDAKCDQCGAYMVMRKTGRGTYKKCSNPDCTTNLKKKDKESEG